MDEIGGEQAKTTPQQSATPAQLDWKTWKGV